MDVSGLTGLSANTANAASAAVVPKAQTPSGTTSSGTASSTSTDTTYYSNPAISYDSITHAVILEWRDTHTGVPLFQSPSQAALLYAEAQNQGRSSQSQSSGKASTQPVSRLA